MGTIISPIYIVRVAIGNTCSVCEMRRERSRLRTVKSAPSVYYYHRKVMCTATKRPNYMVSGDVFCMCSLSPSSLALWLLALHLGLWKPSEYSGCKAAKVKCGNLWTTIAWACEAWNTSSSLPCSCMQPVGSEGILRPPLPAPLIFLWFGGT